MRLPSVGGVCALRSAVAVAPDRWVASRTPAHAAAALGAKATGRDNGSGVLMMGDGLAAASA